LLDDWVDEVADSYGICGSTSEVCKYHRHSRASRNPLLGRGSASSRVRALRLASQLVQMLTCPYPLLGPDQPEVLDRITELLGVSKVFRHPSYLGISLIP
jgi:hypothetical protein